MFHLRSYLDFNNCIFYVIKIFNYSLGTENCTIIFGFSMVYLHFATRFTMLFNVGEYVKTSLHSNDDVDKRNYEDYGFVVELHEKNKSYDVKLQISNELRRNVDESLLSIVRFLSPGDSSRTRSKRSLDYNFDHSPPKKQPKKSFYQSNEDQYTSILLQSLSCDAAVASDHPFVTFILDGKNNEKGWLLHHHREAVVDSKDKVPKGRKKSPSEISFIVMQYFMIKSLPRTYKLGLVTSFCHAWGMSVSGLKKLVSNYVMSLGTNVFSERKDKYDSVFNSEKKRKEAFSPYNIFKKRRRREHYSYYNEYLESKDLKKEWEKIEKNNDTKKYICQVA